MGNDLVPDTAAIQPNMTPWCQLTRLETYFQGNQYTRQVNKNNRNKINSMRDSQLHNALVEEYDQIRTIEPVIDVLVSPDLSALRPPDY